MTKTVKLEDPQVVKEREAKERFAHEKRKRLDELKMKDKIKQLEIELRNFKDKIDFLEKNNLELKNEIDEQERRITRYLSNFVRAKLASDGVRKEGDDEKTSFEKAGKRLLANSYYGMNGGFEDPSQFGSGSLNGDSSESVNQIGKFKENSIYGMSGNQIEKFKENQQNKLNRLNCVHTEVLKEVPKYNPHSICDDEELDDFLSPFDKPTSLVDHQDVNQTLLGKRDGYTPYKHFLVRSPEREIYFLLHENETFREYFVVKFGTIKEMYRSKWKHNGGILGTGKFVEESAIGINPYRDQGYPFDFFPTKNGNFIAKNKRILGENFCLYINFDKWRVSMYRFNKPENAWVIHDFAEVIKYDKTPPKGVIL